MADENTIIEGSVKFRDGKKWKTRWCVMRKLSPVADSVQAQLFREAGPRRGGECKAALALRRLLACESGFTLDKHSHTLALVCPDLALVLAFESRERLMQWQVKLTAALGVTRAHSVLLRKAAGEGPRPARLHIRGPRFALVAGTPPRLLGVWELAHLRRYGIVDGRFCFEGGSLCGEGEGLHVLISDRSDDILRDFDRASEERSSPEPRPNELDRGGGASSPKSRRVSRPDVRLPELNASNGTGPTCDEDPSPLWTPVAGPADATSLCGASAGRVSLQRCASCMSRLGAAGGQLALSRSSTAPLTPGAQHFSPAWTMEPVHELSSSPAPPERPPRPPTGTGKAPMPPPPQTCTCTEKTGPYENYDVPKLSSTEVDGEYYDTPRRLQECLNDELFRVTKTSAPDAVILKKRCGCLLRFGARRREPTVVDADEDFRPACPCRRVTDWIRLPYCRRSTASTDDLAPVAAKETPDADDRGALYATVDPARKTRRKLRPCDRRDDSLTRSADGRLFEVDDGPLANYENLSFALSLEHYENAKDLLRRAGVTQTELDAIGANLRSVSLEAVDGPELCGGCGHPRRRDAGTQPHGDYLTMRPAGYAPMSPGGIAPDPTPRMPPAGRRSSSVDSSRFLDEGNGRDSASSVSVETLRAPGAGAVGTRGGRSARGGAAGGNRDSSSSNDSGVSSCSLRRPAGETDPPAGASGRLWRSVRRSGAPGLRRARSSDPPGLARSSPALKSSSAEAEVPVLSVKPLRGVMDTHSTSSGTSDMSDYIETLSICSSHSSSEAPVALRALRQTTSTLRPRSGDEYRNVDARLACLHRVHRPYTNLP